jgi:CRP-like cAMP-binding protein
VPLTAVALKEVPLFSSLSDEELDELVTLFQERDYAPGHEITKEGRPGFGFFVIESGTAKVTVQGQQRATLGPGAYFGEIALLDDGPRLGTVTTEDSLTAYMLSPREFRPLVQANPNLAWGLLRGLWRILGREDD